MTSYEEIMIFSKGCTANGSKNKMIYNPQGLIKNKESELIKVGLDLALWQVKGPPKRRR